MKDETNHLVAGSTEQQLGADETTNAECVNLQNELPKSGESANLPLSGDRPREFKQFDVIDECSDHNFINQIGAAQVILSVLGVRPRVCICVF
jgi:hypothetical protein